MSFRPQVPPGPAHSRRSVAGRIGGSIRSMTITARTSHPSSRARGHRRTGSESRSARDLNARVAVILSKSCTVGTSGANRSASPRFAEVEPGLSQS